MPETDEGDTVAVMVTGLSYWAPALTATLVVVVVLVAADAGLAAPSPALA